MAFTAAAARLLKQARRLSPEARAWVSIELWASLDDQPKAKIEAAWAKELKRRLRRIEAEGFKGEAWETVVARIERALRR